MLSLIKKGLQQIITDIDSGNSFISEEEQQELLELLYKISQKELSRVQSAKYINKSTSTFDNYIKKGLLPKGHKVPGFNELRWSKQDLENFKNNND